jgi:hypothetical protein
MRNVRWFVIFAIVVGLASVVDLVFGQTLTAIYLALACIAGLLFDLVNERR